MRRFALVVILALVAIVALAPAQPSPYTPHPSPRKPFLRKVIDGVAACILFRNIFGDSVAAEEAQQLRNSLYSDTTELNFCTEANNDKQREVASDGIPLVNHETGW